MTTYNVTTREVPIDGLIVDPQFAALFLEDPAVVGRIAKDMEANGFDPNRPVDVWTNGAGKGNHIIVEGHQRYKAAKRAGLETVTVAYRHFANRHEALLWAAEQQANRRNATKEAQCLAILRALRSVGEESTRQEMADRFGISTATFGRASMVLNRGTESEIVAVIEGTSSLTKTLAAIKAREAQEDEPFDDEDGDRRPKQHERSSDVGALVDALVDRQPKQGPDDLSEALHELQDRIGLLSGHVFQLGVRIEDPQLVYVELRNVIEELLQVNEALSEAYPPGHALEVLIDGYELDDDENKRMAKQGLKRCAGECHEIKPLAEFPTTSTGQPDHRRRGHGTWCLECVNAPDPTMSAGARRAAREKRAARR